MASTPSTDQAGVWRFRIADRFTVQVSSDRAGQDEQLRRFYGPMQCPPDDKLDIDIDCRITNQPLGDAGHRIQQSYKGGHWRLEIDQLELPCRVHLRADRLGRLMAGQAGFGGLLRYLLGRAGFVWLHAAALERAGQAVVLAGPSGVGKSSIVLRAVRDGWRYLTDDHTLIHHAGLSGLTTPILLRGYGDWPDGLTEPTELRKKRRRYAMLNRISGGKANLMAGYTPPPERVYCSPDPVSLPTTLCLLDRGDNASRDSSQAADPLLAQAKQAGRFMSDWLSKEPGDACEAFWSSQAQLIRHWASQCETIHTTVPPRMNDETYQQLAPTIGLEGSRIVE